MGLFNQVSAQMVVTVISVLVDNVLAAGPVAIGLVETAADAVAAFVELWSGRYAEVRPDRRKVTIILGRYRYVGTSRHQPDRAGARASRNAMRRGRRAERNARARFGAEPRDGRRGRGDWSADRRGLPRMGRHGCAVPAPCTHRTQGRGKQAWFVRTSGSHKQDQGAIRGPAPVSPDVAQDQ